MTEGFFNAGYRRGIRYRRMAISEEHFARYANIRIAELVAEDHDYIPSHTTDIIGYFCEPSTPAFADMTVFTFSEMKAFLLSYCQAEGLTIDALGYVSALRYSCHYDLGEFATRCLGWKTKTSYIRDRFEEWCTPKSMASLEYLRSSELVVHRHADAWQRIASKSILAWELRHALPLPRDVMALVMSNLGKKSIFGVWE